MQTQTVLVNAQSQRNREREAQREELEEYIGIKTQFSDPYHVYLSVKDLEADSPIIRFIVFSMGKKKIVLQGYYRRNLNTGQFRDRFRVTYACRYETRNLMEYLTEWEKNFTNVVNITKNRINSRINAFLGAPQNPLLANRDDYISLKAWLSLHPASLYYREGDHEKIETLIQPGQFARIAEEFTSLQQIPALERQLSLTDDIDTIFDLRQDIEDIMDNAIKGLDSMVSKYESQMNIVQFQGKNHAIQVISRKFYEWLSTSKYATNSWAATLSDCSCHTIAYEIISWGKGEELL